MELSQRQVREEMGGGKEIGRYSVCRAGMNFGPLP